MVNAGAFSVHGATGVRQYFIGGTEQIPRRLRLKLDTQIDLDADKLGLSDERLANERVEDFANRVTRVVEALFIEALEDQILSA
jgi:hypothetical protein